MCIIIFISSSCIPEMTFLLLCVLWLTFKWGVQQYSDYWSHAEISSHSKTGTCGGSFIGHWKALRHMLGCQGDVIWKERGSFTVVLPVFFSHSFYILFSSAARRNLFRTARRILRTSERVSKGFIVCSEINETECTLTMHLSWSIHEIHHHLKDNKRQK